MAFSTKIIVGEYIKSDGMSAVHLQAIIDGNRARIPLGFYIKVDAFDPKRQRVKSTHPNAHEFNTEILDALTKANSIASKFRRQHILLTPEAFRREYLNPSDTMDLIKFMKQELELRKPTLSINTHKSHQTTINKLASFQKTILFNQVNRELIQKFRNALVTEGNGPATIEKIIKIVKQYITEARRKGIEVRDVEIKIKRFKSNRTSLSEQEVKKMDELYDKPSCPAPWRKVLRYFLFSCFTGLRVSDIKVITWQNISNDMLTFIPIKTKAKQEAVVVPLLDVDKKYLPAYTSDNKPIFDTYTDQATNRILKQIADHLSIKKQVTYHTSRHTFGSFIAEGGDVVALQRMMGHSNISTSMEYVHTNVKQLIDAKTARFGKRKKKIGKPQLTAKQGELLGEQSAIE